MVEISKGAGSLKRQLKKKLFEDHYLEVPRNIQMKRKHKRKFIKRYIKKTVENRETL